MYVLPGDLPELCPGLMVVSLRAGRAASDAAEGLPDAILAACE